MKKPLAALCLTVLPLLHGCTVISVADAVVSTTVDVGVLAVKGTVGAVSLAARGTAAVAGAVTSDSDEPEEKDQADK